ncbi:MAG: ATP synthase F1 subunit epsilon [Treponema sp.]|nr:ATP synthase F1 subunit epsilon [Treponema sp.]
MAALFKFEVYTPYRRFFSGQAQAVTLTLTDGDITILANHAFCAAPVVPGFLRIKDEGGTWKNAFVSEGIIEVKGHNTILLTDTAEWPEEIDRDRALEAHAAALDAINSSMFKFESAAAEAALTRARLRIKVKDEGNA